MARILYICKPICAKRREMAHSEELSKAKLRSSHIVLKPANLPLSHPLLLAQNLSSKDIARSNITSGKLPIKYY